MKKLFKLGRKAQKLNFFTFKLQFPLHNQFKDKKKSHFLNNYKEDLWTNIGLDINCVSGKIINFQKTFKKDYI